MIYLHIIFTLFLLLMPISTWAAIYQWTDEKGNIAFTDDPNSIPEKYRDNATKMDDPKVPQKPKTDTSPAAPPAMNPTNDTPDLDDEGHDEQWWRTRMQDLRHRKESLLSEKKGLMGRVSSLGRLGLGNIEENDQAKEMEIRIQEIDSEINKIDNELTVIIPDEARKANAPPGWLRE
jgi:hypothetical protein